MHTIILGKTGSGKTFLVKKMIKKWVLANKKVVIFNPTNEIFEYGEPYSERENFYNACMKKGKKYMVVNESPMLLKHDKNLFDTFITKARHYGMMILLVQRPAVVFTPTLISQCSHIIIFKLSLKDDLKRIKNNFGIDEKEVKDLKKYQSKYFVIE
jgi:DNA helicase HerA-like ATPase